MKKILSLFVTTLIISMLCATSLFAATSSSSGSSHAGIGFFGGSSSSPSSSSSSGSSSSSSGSSSSSSGSSSFSSGSSSSNSGSSSFSSGSSSFSSVPSYNYGVTSGYGYSSNYCYSYPSSGVTSYSNNGYSSPSCANSSTGVQSSANSCNGNSQSSTASSVNTKLTVKETSQRAQAIYIQWTKINNAAKYDVYLDGKKRASVSNKYTYVFQQAFTNGRIYKAEVRALDKQGKVLSSGTTYIKKELQPSITYLKQTNVGTKASTAKVLLKWKKQNAADGYKIQYVKGTNFNSNSVHTIYVGKNTTQKEITLQTKGATYSFRIQSQGKYSNKTSYSWYSSKTLTTKK